MDSTISFRQYIAVTAVILTALVVNTWWWHNPLVSMLFGLAYLFIYSSIFGRAYVRQPGWPLFWGWLFLLSLVAILSAGLLYTYRFDTAPYIGVVVALPFIVALAYYSGPKIQKTPWLKRVFDRFRSLFKPRQTPAELITAAIIMAGLIVCWIFLFKGITSTSIQSPWETVSPLFFLAYVIVTAILIVYLQRASSTGLPLILLVSYAAVSFCVAVVVYRIGYGFDPFIHRATEMLINQTGTLSPIPPYYLGQYGLLIFLSRLTGIDLALLDKLFVPLLAALSVPVTTYYVFSQIVKKNEALLLGLGSLVIPYGFFIMTAPQNLANLLYLVTILLSLLYLRNQLRFSALLILTAATATIHPLAGIPLALSICIIALFKKTRLRFVWILSGVSFLSLLFIAVLPIIFATNGWLLHRPALRHAITGLTPIVLVNRFDMFHDGFYWLYFNRIFLALVIVAIGAWYTLRQRQLKTYTGYLFAGGMVIGSYVVIKYFFSSSLLQARDQTDFIDRIRLLALYTVSPLFLMGMHRILQRLMTSSRLLYAGGVSVLTVLLLTSLYASYPRLTDYEPAKFFSVSAADVKAVQSIEDMAAPDHIVLANQMVGAAAIQEFGFKRYYGDEFYYSMPVGVNQALYQAYLKMIYAGAERQTMLAAMTEADVAEAYFVLDRYWRNSEKIAQQATLSADENFSIDHGAVMVFKYVR